MQKREYGWYIHTKGNWIKEKALELIKGWLNKGEWLGVCHSPCLQGLLQNRWSVRTLIWETLGWFVNFLDWKNGKINNWILIDLLLVIFGWFSLHASLLDET